MKRVTVPPAFATFKSYSEESRGGATLWQGDWGMCPQDMEGELSHERYSND